MQMTLIHSHITSRRTNTLLCLSDGLPMRTFNILSRYNPIITSCIQRIGYTVQIKFCVIDTFDLFTQFRQGIKYRGGEEGGGVWEVQPPLTNS
jgi:hypothetical protein